jgi:hypothetical protein
MICHPNGAVDGPPRVMRKTYWIGRLIFQRDTEVEQSALCTISKGALNEGKGLARDLQGSMRCTLAYIPRNLAQTSIPSWSPELTATARDPRLPMFVPGRQASF